MSQKDISLICYKIQFKKSRALINVSFADFPPRETLKIPKISYRSVRQLCKPSLSAVYSRSGLMTHVISRSFKSHQVATRRNASDEQQYLQPLRRC